MMKNNFKNFIVILCVLLVVIFSFCIPKIFFKIEDIYMRNDIVTRKKNNNKIDVETQKIYLVKAIHETKDGTLKISYNEHNINFEILCSNINKELQNLTENEIIVNLNIEDYEDSSIVEYKYTSDDNEYTIQQYSARGKNGMFVSIDIEKKTGKIISLYLDKNIINGQISKREILENYVKYLNLYIIDDWKFENNRLTSDKAKLCVSLGENAIGDDYILTISSTIYENSKVISTYSEPINEFYESSESSNNDTN